MARKKILILCTGNSCRSQLAEALVRHHYSDSWEAFSAGTRPAGFVHPKAIQVLAESGIQHAGESKDVTGFLGVDFDLVVTVCDSAAEDCPLWLGKGKRIHIPFDDPANATGSEQEVLNEFRRVRDEIAAKLPELLQ